MIRLDAMLTSRLLLGGLLAWAGGTKLVRLGAFRQTVEQLGLPWPTLLASTVSITELTIGAAFLVGAYPAVVTSAAAALIIAFIVASIRGRGRAVPCRCFGSSERPLGVYTTVRATLLVLPLATYAWSAGSFAQRPWPHDLAELELCASIAMGACLLAAWGLELAGDGSALPSPRRS